MFSVNATVSRFQKDSCFFLVNPSGDSNDGHVAGTNNIKLMRNHGGGVTTREKYWNMDAKR